MIAMYTVKTRKVGNSISFSIPKQFQVELGKEYVAYQSKNGGLIFSPKMSNPFLSETNYQDSENEAWQSLAIGELEDV